ncbi:hypothetical protein AKO1_004397 [Acrasis kona]|uniref:Uncharacterized protein n=1 Tax=Acrasis kona TaxID=1008807 RepID=A0AAW2YXI6_9EUKA
MMSLYCLWNETKDAGRICVIIIVVLVIVCYLFLAVVFAYCTHLTAHQPLLYTVVEPILNTIIALLSIQTESYCQKDKSRCSDENGIEMESDVATLLERTPEGDTSPASDEQNTAEELNKNSLPGESPAKINPTTVVSSFATYPLYIIISMVIRIILGYAQVVNHMPLQAYSFCIILLTAWSAMDTYANIVKIIRLKISSTEEGTISAKITKEFYEKDGGLSIIFFSLLSFAQCLMIIIVVSFGVTNIGSSPVTVILAVLASIPNFIQKSLLPSDVVPNIQTTLPDNDRE